MVKKETKKKIKLKDVIKAMDLSDYEEIYVYVYGKSDSEQFLMIKDIEKNLMNRECMLVQPNHGGQEHGYSKYRFIVK